MLLLSVACHVVHSMQIIRLAIGCVDFRSEIENRNLSGTHNKRVSRNDHGEVRIYNAKRLLRTIIRAISSRNFT